MPGGKVWLTGAGPGDIGLMTLRAREVIESADLIAYDALIGDEILFSLPDSAEKVAVGKRAGRHCVPQEEINQLLLDEALAGKKVVRLKGGDPFVFGRGGEELELLAEHRIPFEVIPGITSAAAVPAYAGIPVTHRDYTSSFHVITGHPRKDGSDRINYRALAGMDATLVFLMSISRMEAVMENLIQAGMDEETPAAVLENGTRYNQRRVISTVKNLAQDAARAGIGTPAIIVVGQVCALSEAFAWYEKRPLAGRQVVVTQPGERGKSLAEKLRKDGAEVLLAPVMRTGILEDGQVCLERMWTEEKKELWLTFTSPAGVDYFFETMARKETDLRELFSRGKEVRFAAVGQTTAAQLQKYGWKADLIPETYGGESLGKVLVKAADKNAAIFLLCAAGRDRSLTDELDRAGRAWIEIPLYETHKEENYRFADQIKERIENNPALTVTFASASAVDAFAAALADTDMAKVQALCIGPKTAGRAEKYGMKTVTAARASEEALVDRLRGLTI